VLAEEPIEDAAADGGDDAVLATADGARRNT